MKKTLVDGANLTRAALCGIDDGWYDNYWYSERPHSRLSPLGGVVRLLRGMIASVRASHSASPVGRDVSVVPQRHPYDLVAAGED